jgi:hypothetical protein
MCAIITDPLYKALNTLTEKKAAWQKVRGRLPLFIYIFWNLADTMMNFTVYRQPESEKARCTVQVSHSLSQTNSVQVRLISKPFRHSLPILQNPHPDTPYSHSMPHQTTCSGKAPSSSSCISSASCIPTRNRFLLVLSDI